MSADRFPRGKTAIVGATTYGMGESPGLSSVDLAVSASVRALDQVGLKPGDVDGLFIGSCHSCFACPTKTQNLRLEEPALSTRP